MIQSAHFDVVVTLLLMVSLDTGIVSAQQLANAIPNAIYKKTFNEAADFVKAQAKKGDIVITMGAGDVYKIGDILLSYNE